MKKIKVGFEYTTKLKFNSTSTYKIFHKVLNRQRNCFYGLDIKTGYIEEFDEYGNYEGHWNKLDLSTEKETDLTDIFNKE